jgi:phosphatidylinositol glycan class A protein
LEQHIHKHGLQDRVELLGSIPHNQVRNVMTRGHIFLNTSLTEAFCIAIVEAASTGLFVVATDVGGVTEVLPHDMVLLAKPNPIDIIAKLEEAIPKARNIPTQQFHERVS